MQQSASQARRSNARLDRRRLHLGGACLQNAPAVRLVPCSRSTMCVLAMQVWGCRNGGQCCRSGPLLHQGLSRRYFRSPTAKGLLGVKTWILAFQAFVFSPSPASTEECNADAFKARAGNRLGRLSSAGSNRFASLKRPGLHGARSHQQMSPVHSGTLAACGRTRDLLDAH